ARGAAGKDRLARDQPPAAPDAVEVGDVDHRMDEAGIAERRPDAGPQPGDQPRAGVGVETGEDAAADRVHGDDPDRQPAIPYVFAAATQSAAGAGGDEQVVELAVEL